MTIIVLRVGGVTAADLINVGDTEKTVADFITDQYNRVRLLVMPVIISIKYVQPGIVVQRSTTRKSELGRTRALSNGAIKSTNLPESQQKMSVRLTVLCKAMKSLWATGLISAQHTITTHNCWS